MFVKVQSVTFVLCPSTNVVCPFDVNKNGILAAKCKHVYRKFGCSPIQPKSLRQIFLVKTCLLQESLSILR